MSFIELVKIFLLGIVEGVTEWLPISSTGHMLLLDAFVQLQMREEFKNVFFVVIQLGAILAVVVMFWEKMFPFSPGSGRAFIKKETMSIWLKVAVACVPAAIAGVLLEDFLESTLSTPVVIATALILYGILFIVIEERNSSRRPGITHLAQIGFGTALIIGCFQALSLIPGTSRSGATIIGALLVGVSRTAAAEFTFFLAVPTMLGASAYKLFRFGLAFSGAELLALSIGMLVAFAVSMMAISFLMDYIRRHDFSLFGWYRIVLGSLVLMLSLGGVI